jgi:general secretion pathway protein H
MAWRCESVATAAGIGDKRRQRAGFTLVEVLIVLAIMVAIIAILMPMGGRQRQHTQLAAGAREVAEGLRLTRSRAILDNRPAAFLIDVQKNVFRVAGAAAPEALPRDVNVALFTTADATNGPSVGAIRFYPDGSSTGGGVTLSAAGEAYLVRVDWLTGGISIHEQNEPKH